MDSLDALLRQIECDEVIGKLSISPAELDSFLDLRDLPAFSSYWMELFNQVAAKKGASKTADTEPRVAQLRELCYRQAYSRWRSPDLAGYVSDDFGLIGDALALGIRPPAIERLLASYLSGVFPVRWNPTDH